MQPEEKLPGPSFLAPKNYFVLKDYNFSDLYVLFVGHLSDRIAGGKPFETWWSKNAQLKTVQVETMQQRLAALGLYKDKIDGKAGMLTRAALRARAGRKTDEGSTAGRPPQCSITCGGRSGRQSQTSMRRERQP